MFGELQSKPKIGQLIVLEYEFKLVTSKIKNLNWNGRRRKFTTELHFKNNSSQMHSGKQSVLSPCSAKVN